ncbi:hypothetical protein LTR08_006002 [Meristemomyces frigidus]|nr:hypothetical protein LTR08_006002 [Meristemomyces frigidus]
MAPASFDLDALPNEIVNHIFLALPSVSAVLALAATNVHFNAVYHKQRLSILTAAADAEFGPLDAIVQILTHNASQPAHTRRAVPMSDALFRQVLHVGRVAQQWEDIYPLKKWKTDFANRRLLTRPERYLLRRALYRLWLYSKAFHTRHYIRTTRNHPPTLHERATLLHNLPTTELAEMFDVQTVVRDMVANNICPSNGKIRQKIHKRYPDSSQQPVFNVQLNTALPPSPSWCAADDGWLNNSIITSAKYHHRNAQQQRSRLQPSRFRDGGAEGWGDDISHYYVVEDMMKLDPEQLLLLRDRCQLKAQVEAYVRGFEGGGEWFTNNGETFSETLAFVIKQRGGEMVAFKDGVGACEMGVAVAVAVDDDA